MPSTTRWSGRSATTCARAGAAPAVPAAVRHPFALCFLLLWWAPPWQSQIALMIHVTLAFMISDTIQTLVIVPYLSLTPEIAPDYDERTALTGYRMFFNLLASLATAVAAPMIVDGMQRAGFSAQQGYLATAALFGGLAALPFLVIFFVIRERTDERTPVAEPVSLRHTVRTLWANVPFRFATLLNMLNWITFDLVALMLPFFLVYWVAGGDLVYQVDLLGVKLAIESAVLGLMFVVAVIALPLWTWAAQRFGKRAAYIGGMSFWAVVQCVILLIGQGQVSLVLWLAVLAGIGVSTAHVLPDAIFSRRDRVGRAADAPAPRGHVLRRQELHPQDHRRAGDLSGAAGAGLVGLPGPARGRHQLRPGRERAAGHPDHDWAGRGAAAGRRGAGGLALPAHARAAPARAAAAGAAAPARGSGSLDRRAHSREPSVARHTWPRAGRIWYNSADSIPALHPWIGRTT
ncbi:MAG: MFS transporter [Kouleothrix sp.]|nr:MFS transporter [Kouleothrix sp.]